MTESEMDERVARAIFAVQLAHEEDSTKPCGWDDAHKSDRDLALAISRATIEAYTAALADAGLLQSGWRPIETAPENESVLIFIPNAEHYGVGVYRGMLVNMGTGRHWSANAVAMGRDCGHNQPTHWMPLPEPPEDPR